MSAAIQNLATRWQNLTHCTFKGTIRSIWRQFINIGSGLRASIATSHHIQQGARLKIEDRMQDYQLKETSFVIFSSETMEFFFLYANTILFYRLWLTLRGLLLFKWLEMQEVCRPSGPAAGRVARCSFPVSGLFGRGSKRWLLHRKKEMSCSPEVELDL